MKRNFIFPAVAILVAAVVFTSCGPSRVYATNERHERNPAPPPPPRHNYSVSLIISPTPGFVMNRYADGRYYHRSPNGYMYWKGYDNRFYLDRSYIHRVSYSQWEYDQWKRYSKNKNKGHNRKGNTGNGRRY